MYPRIIIFKLTIWNLIVGKTFTSCFNNTYSFRNNSEQWKSGEELEQLLCRGKKLVEFGNLIEALTVYQQIKSLAKDNLPPFLEITYRRAVWDSNSRAVIDLQESSAIENKLNQTVRFKNVKLYYGLWLALRQIERIEEIIIIYEQASNFAISQGHTRNKRTYFSHL